MKNEGFIERGIQLSLSAALLNVAFFWLGGYWAILVGLLASVMGIFALIGFCPLYLILGIKREQTREKLLRKKIIVAILFFMILVGGAYASNFFTKKLFITDFNAMNTFYKQTLFETGQEKKAESLVNYMALREAYAKFSQKYAVRKPYVIRGDASFDKDLILISSLIENVEKDIKDGDLKKAHLELEKVRPITQEIFKRNGFSMLAISLVDFHDSMEKVLEEAEQKNAVGVIATYAEANSKLLAVEAENNDQEIQIIRKKLEVVLQSAKEGKIDELPGQAAELKSSFVKVYLKRG